MAQTEPVKKWLRRRDSNRGLRTGYARLCRLSCGTRVGTALAPTPLRKGCAMPRHCAAPTCFTAGCKARRASTMSPVCETVPEH